MARHRGGVDRGLQIQRRDRHAEIDAGAAFDGAVHDLSAEPAQGGSALVLPPDQGAHLVAVGQHIAVTLRPMAPTAPAAPVTRIGLSCVDFIIISLA